MNDQSGTKPPAVLDGLLQPGFPLATVFTAFLLEDTVVFAKSGSGGTNAAGTMSASLGGFTPAAMVAGAIGSVVDSQTADQRADKAAQMSAYSPEQLVAAHKRNFAIPFADVRSVEIAGPNFAGEVKVVVTAGKTHKFRVDKQSKEAAKYIADVFDDALPGKVVRK